MISEGLLVAGQYRVIGNQAPEGFDAKCLRLCIPTGRLPKQSEPLRH
ncbi:hypothetical protein O9993_11705 [Vibrio lentus]|nr:hypothetical protein [Vibrio lentus]